MRRHAEALSPEECCGILIGRVEVEESVVLDVVLTTNVADDRERRYDIDARQLLDAHRRVRQSSDDIIGYFHSHPSSAPRPSATDRQHAWPETSYLILGLKDGELSELRSWRLQSADGDFVEETVVVL